MACANSTISASDVLAVAGFGRSGFAAAFGHRREKNEDDGGDPWPAEIRDDAFDHGRFPFAALTMSGCGAIPRAPSSSLARTEEAAA
jgi:hypothetical protein